MSFNSEDPLGFTKRTAAILDGLGAGAIVNEFKKRNISTDALGKLTKDDFIKLGASNELADSMYQQFNTKKTYKLNNQNDDDDNNRIDNLFEILKTGKEHLSLIKAFIAYSRKRLTMDPHDFIVDSNKNERASTILHLAVKATLNEVDQLENEIFKLKSQVNKGDKNQCCPQTYLLTFLGGLGLSLALVYHWKRF